MRKSSVLSTKAIALGIFVVAVFGSVACASYRAWRYPCISREPGLRGEIMRSADGKFLYFNGSCWTARPMPPRDTPF
jgi:hypothetical protein